MPVTTSSESAAPVQKMPTPPDVVLIAGADKLSIYAFARVVGSTLTSSHALGLPMHSYMTPGDCEAYFKEWSSRKPKSVLTYYARKKNNFPEPLMLLPNSLVDGSGLIVWFDLYSMEPRVLKDECPEFTAWLLAGWKNRVKD